MFFVAYLADLIIWVNYLAYVLAAEKQRGWGLMGALERNISKEFNLADLKLHFILRKLFLYFL